MFIRYRGGGVGHKSTRKATRSLLNDRETLDKQPFILERDRNLFEEATEEIDEDDPMTDSSSTEEESDEESDEDRSAMEGIGENGKQPVDDELGDEMDEFGYSGLDQVLEDDKDSGDEDALGLDSFNNEDAL
jgi:hypothetical protein